MWREFIVSFNFDSDNFFTHFVNFVLQSINKKASFVEKMSLYKHTGDYYGNISKSNKKCCCETR